MIRDGDRRLSIGRRAAGILVFALLAASAAAQKPALVQDRDEPGRSPYTQTLSVVSPATDCTGNLCLVRVAAVPAGKRLVVTHASGQLNADTDGNANPFVIATMMTYSGGVTLPYIFLPVAQPYGSPSSTSSGVLVSSPVMQFYEAGTAPLMLGSTSGTFNAVVFSLVGYYVSVP